MLIQHLQWIIVNYLIMNEIDQLELYIHWILSSNVMWMTREWIFDTWTARWESALIKLLQNWQVFVVNLGRPDTLHEHNAKCLIADSSVKKVNELWSTRFYSTFEGLEMQKGIPNEPS